MLIGLNVGSAQAATVEVKLGTDAGMLAFEPSTVTIKAGDTVKFVNNKLAPHNAVFEGNDQYNAVFEETFSERPDFYCEPHRGAGRQSDRRVICFQQSNPRTPVFCGQHQPPAGNQKGGSGGPRSIAGLPEGSCGWTLDAELIQLARKHGFMLTRIWPVMPTTAASAAGSSAAGSTTPFAP